MHCFITMLHNQATNFFLPAAIFFKY
ncbi:hypothetical protein MXB_2188 [Myxobolus squamalis]|nr:hypothetical protein MXB_2188 [Myxobolus squamalis]